jgi:hypothetical protein
MQNRNANDLSAGEKRNYLPGVMGVRVRAAAFAQEQGRNNSLAKVVFSSAATDQIRSRN